MTDPERQTIIHGTPTRLVFMDEATGVFGDIPIASPETVCIGWDDVGAPPTDIATSSDFTCLIDGCTYDGSLWVQQETRQWRHAVDLADRLNDLIEEYHSPGNLRRVKKSIKRQFDKTFKVFLKHCRRNHIDFTFTKIPI